MSISPVTIRIYRRLAIGVACVSALILFIIARNFLPDISWWLLIPSIIAVTFIVWATTSYFLFRNTGGRPALSNDEMRMYAVKNMTHLVVFAEDATSQQIDNFSLTGMFGKKLGEAGVTSITRFPLSDGRRAFALKFSDGKSEKERDLAVATLSSMPGVQTVERGFERIADD